MIYVEFDYTAQEILDSPDFKKEIFNTFIRKLENDIDRCPLNDEDTKHNETVLLAIEKIKKLIQETIND